MKEKGLNIISSRQFEREANKECVMFALVTKDVSMDSEEELPEEIGFGLSDPSKVAKFYFNEVVKLCGLPKLIGLDRDIRFMSFFLESPMAHG